MSSCLKPQQSVLHSTLKDKVSGQVVHGTKPGPKPYLTATEEKELAGLVIEAANTGYAR